MMREMDIKAAILAHFGANPRFLIWNHPSGVGRDLSSERVIRFGLAGSPDIIGAVAVTIREEHVGQTWGRAIGIEVKSARGVHGEHQKKFAAAWTQRVSGLYCLARGIDDVSQLLEAVS